MIRQIEISEKGKKRGLERRYGIRKDGGRETGAKRERRRSTPVRGVSTSLDSQVVLGGKREKRMGRESDRL